METGECIKAVIRAANQFQNNMCDGNLLNLQRQLDLLIGIIGRGPPSQYFNSQDIFSTECLTCICDLLYLPDIKLVMCHKCVVLLAQLATSEELRQVLHSRFHFTSALACVLKAYGASSADSMVIECVELLRCITYGHKVDFHESYMEDLISFVIKKIQATESVLTQPCLGLLANLCHNNFSVQTHIKTTDGTRAFYRCLVAYTHHEHLMTIVFSLSLLFSLSFGEELGEKLFKGQNLHQTFQVIFNILIQGDAGITRHYAVDLFTDLIKHPKYQQSLLIFERLPVCLESIVKLLPTSTVNGALKLLELLLGLCVIGELRPKVCSCLMDTTTASPNSGDPMRQPLWVMLQWASATTDAHITTALRSLDLLKELYEEMLFSGALSTIPLHLNLLLPTLTAVLSRPLEDGETNSIALRCQRLNKALQLTTLLCTEDSVRASVCNVIDIQMFLRVIEFQFCHNPFTMGSNNKAREKMTVDWSADGACMLIYTLDLMRILQSHIHGMDTALAQALQDVRVVPFLVHGLSSGERQLVQNALSLLHQASTLHEFPLTVLGDSLAASNFQSQACLLESADVIHPHKVHISEARSRGNKEDFVQSVSSKPGNRKLGIKATDDKSAVQDLINRLQSGMELNEIKRSEISTFYEYKLQNLQTKESHLQDLLDAKKLVISHADRLIAKNHCHIAKLEAEAAKMSSLLHDCDKSREEAQVQVSVLTEERERLTQEVSQLTVHNNRLERVSEEFREMCGAMAEQTEKLEVMQRSLISLKQDHASLNEIHDLLKKHYETLKQQSDGLLEQLEEAEIKRKSMQKELKREDDRYKELSRSHQSLQEQYKALSEEKEELCKEKEELLNAVDKMTRELARTETLRKQFQQQVKSLEEVCKQHEAAIQEKDKTIYTFKSNLDKHAQIAALIHNLSAGNVDHKDLST